MDNNVALVTGVTGQYGSYMAERLLKDGYSVIGVHRHASYENFHNLGECLKNPSFKLERADLTDSGRIFELIYQYPVTEVYNFGGVSSHKEANTYPQLAMDTNALGCMRLLEAIRKKDTNIRFFQASSCEIFGWTVQAIQDEDTEINPTNIYGISKASAHHLVRSYSRLYGIRGINGILYNSSSPRRDRRFVTRIITDYVAALLQGRATDKLSLHNLDFIHDFSDAREIVRAIYRLMQVPYVDSDFILGSGFDYSVRQLCQTAFGLAGLDYRKFVVEESDREQEQVYIADTRKVSMRTGWYYSRSLESLLYDMVLDSLEKNNG